MSGETIVTLSPLTLTFLALVGAVAGFVDAIAGGGGVLTTPALLLALGKVDAHLVLGTNKGQAVFGSGVALARFSQSPLLHRRRALISFFPALLGSAAGVCLTELIPSQILRPLVLILLAAVALFMIFYRPPKIRTTPPSTSALPAILIAFTIAAYDGFFGPGTGTFLILAFVLAYHDTLDAASANAKLVNFGSNLAALLLFAAQGQVVWQAVIPMAAGQALGGYTGAHVTIRHGRELVRYVAVIVSFLLIAWVAWRWWMG